MGVVVYAGVDFKAILDQAEKEGDVVVWDGGNNDFSFYRPDFTVTVVDPLRPGDETRSYPGETNVRLADAIVINKVNVASRKSVEQMARTCASLNSRADIIKMKSEAVVDHPELVRRKRALVVEDGPSVTHGGLSEGAGAMVARSLKATLVSPKSKAVGSIKQAYARFPKLGRVIPALGYSSGQLRDLEKSINGVRCQVVVLGTPSDITRLIRIRHPVARVRFEASQEGGPSLEALLRGSLKIKALASV
jgi:predicted GTPase